jgi:hypothetical protein
MDFAHGFSEKRYSDAAFGRKIGPAPSVDAVSQPTVAQEISNCEK